MTPNLAFLLNSEFCFATSIIKIKQNKLTSKTIRITVLTFLLLSKAQESLLKKMEAHIKMGFLVLQRILVTQNKSPSQKNLGLSCCF